MYTQHTTFNGANQSPVQTSLSERPLREWPIGERPVERLVSYGSAALSDVEIIAALLSGSASTASPVTMAQQLIVTFGGWSGMQRASLDELASIPGLGRTRAVRLKAALEVGRRLLLAPPGERLQIRSPADAAQLPLRVCCSC